MSKKSRQSITSIKGCMSRCKQRGKGTNAVGHHDESKPKKRAKSRTKRSSCKINEPAGVPSASRMKVTRPLNTFPAHFVCMNRYTRRLDPVSRSWIARRLASVRLSWDGTYDLSNVDTAGLAPICTPRLSSSVFLSFSLLFLLSYPISRYARLDLWEYFEAEYTTNVISWRKSKRLVSHLCTWTVTLSSASFNRTGTRSIWSVWCF